MGLAPLGASLRLSKFAPGEFVERVRTVVAPARNDKPRWRGVCRFWLGD